jgi:Type II secretion system (T2SS), protein M subtype b
VSFWRRVFVEKRAPILALLVGAVANVAVYVLAVYPLAVKSGGAADRASVAAASRRAAEQDFAGATALVTGKTRAEQELSTFYDKVLPADESHARRQTYTALPNLARRANVRFAERKTDVDLSMSKNSRVGRLQIRMVLSGEWESIRQFIYDVESASEFVIIDDVILAQTDPSKPLTLTLELSTYFRLGTHGN